MTTKNLDGVERTFTSQSDLDRTCKELGVVQRADAAWITQEYRGVDWRTGKQRYVEGSGAGLPGSWAAKPALLDASPEEIERFFDR